MFTNIPKHNIPDELSRYLEGKQVDFIVRNNRDYYEIINVVIMTFFSIFALSVIFTAVFLWYRHHIDLFLDELDKIDIIFFSFSVFSFIYLGYYSIKFLFFTSSYFRNLFNPPTIFVGTDQHLIVYNNNKFLVLSWRHFNRSTLVLLTGKHKGDIVFRLYNDQKIINEYDGKEVKPENIKISEVENADELEKIIRKHIDMIQGE